MVTPAGGRRIGGARHRDVDQYTFPESTTPGPEWAPGDDRSVGAAARRVAAEDQGGVQVETGQGVIDGRRLLAIDGLKLVEHGGADFRNRNSGPRGSGSTEYVGGQQHARETCAQRRKIQRDVGVEHDAVGVHYPRIGGDGAAVDDQLRIRRNVHRARACDLKRQLRQDGAGLIDALVHRGRAGLRHGEARRVDHSLGDHRKRRGVGVSRRGSCKFEDAPGKLRDESVRFRLEGADPDLRQAKAEILCIRHDERALGRVELQDPSVEGRDQQGRILGVRVRCDIHADRNGRNPVDGLAQKLPLRDDRGRRTLQRQPRAEHTLELRLGVADSPCVEAVPHEHEQVETVPGWHGRGSSRGRGTRGQRDFCQRQRECRSVCRRIRERVVDQQRATVASARRHRQNPHARRAPGTAR